MTLPQGSVNMVSLDLPGIKDADLGSGSGSMDIDRPEVQEIDGAETVPGSSTDGAEPLDPPGSTFVETIIRSSGHERLDLPGYLIPIHETEDYVDVKKIPRQIPGLEAPDFVVTSSPMNPYVLERFNKEEDGSRGEYSGCMPNFPHLDYSTRVQLPHYAFRATHGGSGGYTSKGHFKSKAMVEGLGATDFFKFDNKQMKALIERHINGEWFKEDHWISFTDSIATVIGRALKYEQEGKTNVKIHIVDTHQIQEPSLIVWAYASMKAYKACQRLRKIRYKMLVGASYNEFLVWDQLKVVGSYASLRELKMPVLVGGPVFGTGLLDLIPKLKYKSKSVDHLGREVWKAVKPRKIQDSFYGLEDDVRFAKEPGRSKVGIELRCKDLRAPIGRHNIWDYLSMVNQVDEEFRLPMLIAFLLMKTKVFYWDTIVDEVAEIAAIFPKPSRFYDTNLSTPAKIDVQYYRGILRRVYRKLEVPIKAGWARPYRNIICTSDREGIKKKRSEKYYYISQSLKRKLEAQQKYPEMPSEDGELTFEPGAEFRIDETRPMKNPRIDYAREAMLRAMPEDRLTDGIHEHHRVPALGADDIERMISMKAADKKEATARERAEELHKLDSPSTSLRRLVGSISGGIVRYEKWITET